MKTRHYVLIAVLGSVLVIPLLFMTLCNSVFQQEPGAVLSSGKHVAVDEVKTPLAASVVVRQRSGSITFSFLLKDADGREIRSLRGPSGRPKSPKVKIFDAQGKCVHTSAMEYG